jgi:hypothetical protein
LRECPVISALTIQRVPRKKKKEENKLMKKITAFLVVAAAAALLYSGCGQQPETRQTWQIDAAQQSVSAPAGTITITSGPTFTPESAFTNNTIVVDTSQGSLTQVSGNATITPDATNQVTAEISGTYSANPGDVFSLAYSFVVDLNAPTPVTYTADGMATIMGIPVPFHGGGTLVPGLNRYEGEEVAPFAFFFADSGDFSATVVLDFGGLGALAAVPGSLDITIEQIEVKLDPNPATVQAPSQSLNISTRLNVGTDDSVLIGGFIIAGTNPKAVVLRAIGPSLASFGVNGVLADPLLELHDSSGATLATNDNWMDLSTEDQTTLNDSKLAPTDGAESALVATLDPGAYTAIVSGVNNSTGVALVEVYDIDGGATDSNLANISTRGSVETGESVMIGGFIIGGGGGGFETVIARGIGPSLTNFGVAGALADPFLELHNGDGDVIASNDNWMDDANMQQVSDANLAPTDPNESAIFEILPPGLYTAILSGVGDASGVGLVEAYDIQ